MPPLRAQEVIKTNSELQSAARALADQAEMRMSDLEAQFKRRLEADQASLRAETERLKQVGVRVQESQDVRCRVSGDIC